MNALPFSVLPSGSVIALLVIGWSIFLLRRSGQRRTGLGVLLFGLFAASIFVVLLHLDLRLPWLAACVDCLAGNAAYSYVLTFFQAFGWFGGLAIIVLRCTIGRSARHV